jgi:membrane associated rhomboid family serine protease
MFPLRDSIRSRSVPLVTWSLIGINVLIFLFEVSLGPAELQRVLADFGLVPARLIQAGPLGWPTLVTSMFLHGGWFHLISNLWTLAIFGDNVEDRMGPARYLAFYLLAGVAAGAAQVAFDPLARIPTIGASGAIAGVLGAYFLSSGLVALGAAGGPGSFEGIAWWAHIGGFAFGLLLVRPFARRRRRLPYDAGGSA